jgi:hypothetical protein
MYFLLFQFFNFDFSEVRGGRWLVRLQRPWFGVCSKTFSEFNFYPLGLQRPLGRQIRVVLVFKAPHRTYEYIWHAARCVDLIKT